MMGKNPYGNARLQIFTIRPFIAAFYVWDIEAERTTKAVDVSAAVLGVGEPSLCLALEAGEVKKKYSLLWSLFYPYYNHVYINFVIIAFLEALLEEEQ